MVRVRAASSPLSKPRVARRRPRHSVEYKMMVVRAALRRPEEARVKPTCRYIQALRYARHIFLMVSERKKGFLSPCAVNRSR